jgi:ATP phosphoribosyltransferase regulatory subunit
LPSALHEPISETLARKDSAALAKLAQDAQIPQDTTEHLLALTELYGDLDVLASAERSLRWPAAQKALAGLRELVELLSDRTRARLGFDFSDARGASYYTGMSFHLLAAGPGESIGAGGRYDQLLERYGRALPATGFAFDLENLQWALREAGVARTEPRVFRIAVALGDAVAQRKLAGQLRADDCIVATLPVYQELGSCLAFARAWGYDALLALDRERARLVRASDGAEQAVQADDPASIRALQKWAQEAAKD